MDVHRPRIIEPPVPAEAIAPVTIPLEPVPIEPVPLDPHSVITVDPPEQVAPPAPQRTIPRPHPSPPTGAPAPVTGTFIVTGDVDRVRLIPAQGGAVAPGDVAPGTYDVEATFASRQIRMGKVEIRPSEQVIWKCERALENCGPPKH